MSSSTPEIPEAARDAADTVKDAAETVKGTAKDAVDSANETLDTMADRIESGASDAVAEAKSAAGEASDSASDAAAEATDAEVGEPASTDEPAEVSAPEAKPKEFNFSVLVSAFNRFFKNFWPFVVAIAINALVQAVLTATGVSVGANIGSIIAILISLAALVWAAYYITKTALEGSVSKPTVSQIYNENNHTWIKFALWGLGLFLLTFLVRLFFPLAALLVLALFAFVPLAAVEGKVNPLKANFQAIKDRPGRWLVTSIILLVITLILMFLTAANGFLIGGFPGSLIMWFVWGAYAAWVLLAYALVYRSTRVGASESSDTDGYTPESSDDETVTAG